MKIYIIQERIDEWETRFVIGDKTIAELIINKLSPNMGSFRYLEQEVIDAWKHDQSSENQSQK